VPAPLAQAFGQNPPDSGGSTGKRLGLVLVLVGVTALLVWQVAAMNASFAAILETVQPTPPSVPAASRPEAAVQAASASRPRCPPAPHRHCSAVQSPCRRGEPGGTGLPVPAVVPSTVPAPAAAIRRRPSGNGSPSALYYQRGRLRKRFIHYGGAGR
jgi:hypothetical protein